MPSFEPPRDTYTVWHQRGFPVEFLNPALCERFSSGGETCFLTLHRIADADSSSARRPKVHAGLYCSIQLSARVGTSNPWDLLPQRDDTIQCPSSS